MSLRLSIARGLFAIGEWVAPAREPDDCEKVLVERMTVADGKIDIALSHSIVKDMAGHLATWFDAASEGGPGNYVEVEMAAPDGRTFTMTVQRRSRPTPHEMREKWEKRAREAEARLDVLSRSTPTNAKEGA